MGGANRMYLAAYFGDKDFGPFPAINWLLQSLSFKLEELREFSFAFISKNWVINLA